MRNIFLVAKREYQEQIRGRAFIVSTVMVPLVMVALMAWGSFTESKAASGKHVAIVAENQVLANEVRRRMLDDKDAKVTVDVVAPASQQDGDALRKHIQRGGQVPWQPPPPVGATP